MLLRDLYQEMIVDHGKQPRNFGKLEQATCCRVGHNPLCGDKLVLYIKINQGIVEEISFEGSGCAISVASASLMTETIKGKPLQEAHHLFELFHLLVTEGKEAQEQLGKLAVFSGVAAFPVRVKCASLPWHTLKAALNDETQTVTTE